MHQRNGGRCDSRGGTPHPLQMGPGDLERKTTPMTSGNDGVLTGDGSSVPWPKAQSHRVLLECDDEYEGELGVEPGADVAVPHGKGTLFSRSGQYTYVGDFTHRWRDGYGKLTTDRYVLWSRWRMNRPDLTKSTRVDYPNGDRYCGFLRLQQVPHAAQNTYRSGRPVLSEFSAWVESSTPVRERWGELVMKSGDRYFGQWEDDTPNGFGCYLTVSGDRYVGLFKNGKFHDTGALFTTAAGACSSDGLLSGVQMAPITDDLASTSMTQPPSAFPISSGAQWAGLILDGVWNHGRFEGEGHVTLTSGTRVTAVWNGLSQPHEGEVVCGGVRDVEIGLETHCWRECFHWEALMRGVEETRQSEHATCEGYREQLYSATTVERMRVVLLDFLHSQSAIHHVLKIFRRCFYFMYGTCGSSEEIGDGHGSNPLGWCNLRNAFGGCIHQRRGTPISGGHLDLALIDILSLARTIQRWVFTMLGESSEEQLVYCGGELVIGRWVADQVLGEVHDVLLNLYRRVYHNEELAVSSGMARLRGRITMDDLGVDFARAKEEERLFDSYADAIHRVEQLSHAARTLTSKLRVLTQWSREIDLSTQLAQVRVDDGGGPLFGRNTSRRYQCGSADDLLPIHQYVLTQSRVKGLFAHMKFLLDFAAERTFIDPASQDAFSIATLQACVVTIARLHPLIRDHTSVLVPLSVLEDRVRRAVAGLSARLKGWRMTVHQHLLGRVQGYDGDAMQLGCILRGYVRMWVPRTLGLLGEHPQRGCLYTDAGLDLQGDGWGDGNGGHLLLDESCEQEVKILCWVFAGTLFEAMGLQLRVVACDGSLITLGAETNRVEELCQRCPCEVSFSLASTRPVLSSVFYRMEELLLQIL